MSGQLVSIFGKEMNAALTKLPLLELFLLREDREKNFVPYQVNIEARHHLITMVQPLRD